jgi:hypothetical protein
MNYTNPEVVYGTDFGFDFAVSTYPDIPTSIGTISVWLYGKANYVDFDPIPMELEPCTNSSLNYTDSAELELKGIAFY